MKMAEINHQREEGEEEEEEKEEGENREEGIELSLGLSLNGKFGVDPKAKKLKRCYSISNFTTPVVENTGFPWEKVPLSRTCSLPVEAGEESRKRKEIQMLRRREAKQRRVQKMRYGSGSGLDAPLQLQGVGCLPPPLSQGSSGSSSGFSDFDSQTPPPPSGMNKNTEAKSPQSVQSLEQNEHRSLATKLSGRDNMTEVHSPPRSFSGAGEMVRNVLADMPCVSTRGDGPNGKRIEGFLYRYKNGVEVRIVCVCHGSFLTPAEFVKHAGGGDVEHPLRHIVVNSSSFL